jgi:hypothetical protein
MISRMNMKKKEDEEKKKKRTHLCRKIFPPYRPWNKVLQIPGNTLPNLCRFRRVDRNKAMESPPAADSDQV